MKEQREWLIQRDTDAAIHANRRWSPSSKAALMEGKAIAILTTDLLNEIERTMSDFLAYDGVRQWWKTRKHWHTEAFASVVDAIIARGEKPTAYSTYDLKQVVLPRDS